MIPRKNPKKNNNRSLRRAVLCAALLFVLCVGFVGCGGTGDTAPAGGGSGGSASDPANNTSAGGGSGSCTLEIDCKALLADKDKLNPSKASLVPADGVLLAERKVALRDGETVFDVLASVCKEEKLPMDSTGGAASGGAYVQGIGNLYEFDAGPESGWRYSVNGTYPGQSSSLQKVKNGDVICWSYTLDGSGE